ncbi:hypothetical protein IFM47457_11132 [Aspergillus lentulus]|nr:hypothetical protein IFM47457_11132 [Aspergillus lentulus]
MFARDRAEWSLDVEYVTNNVYPELEKAATALAKREDTSSLQLRSHLSGPMGLHRAGWSMRTKGTHDLLFSMERLSINPYVVRRLHPRRAVSPLWSMREWCSTWREEEPSRLSATRAACTAYFFIHPLRRLSPSSHHDQHGEWPPHIYTMDETHDWLFAKMAFDMNDLFHLQLYHLANTHDVADSVHLAALRTMSARHSVRGYLDRLISNVPGICSSSHRSGIALQKKGLLRQFFCASQLGWQGNRDGCLLGACRALLGHELLLGRSNRGLVDCSYGPRLSSFPFYETAAPMDWIIEATNAAEVIDFVLAPMLEREDFANIALRSTASSVLPLNPSSFNRPLPETKGSLDSLLPWSRNGTPVLKQTSLLVCFNRTLQDEQEGNLSLYVSRIQLPGADEQTASVIHNAGRSSGGRCMGY